MTRYRCYRRATDRALDAIGDWIEAHPVKLAVYAACFIVALNYFVEM